MLEAVEPPPSISLKYTFDVTTLSRRETTLGISILAVSLNLSLSLSRNTHIHIHTHTHTHIHTHTYTYIHTHTKHTLSLTLSLFRQTCLHTISPSLFLNSLSLSFSLSLSPLVCKRTITKQQEAAKKWQEV